MSNFEVKYHISSERLYNYDIFYGGVLDNIFKAYKNNALSDESLLDNIVITNLDVFSFFPLNRNTIIPRIEDIVSSKLSGFFCYYYPENLRFEVWQFYKGERHGFHRIYNIDTKPGVVKNSRWENTYPYNENCDELLNIVEVFSEEYYKNELVQNSESLNNYIEQSKAKAEKIKQVLIEKNYHSYDNINYYKYDSNNEVNIERLLLFKIDQMVKIDSWHYPSEKFSFGNSPFVNATGYTFEEELTHETRSIIYLRKKYCYYKQSIPLLSWTNVKIQYL
jgi:hypothetical protein